jgi:hypothetical protein
MSAPLTLLGPDIDHRLSLEVMLKGHRTLNWVPDSSTFLKSRGAGWLTRNLRRFDRLLGTRNQDYLAHVQQSLDSQGSEIVVAYWGTEPLPDLLAVKRLRPHVKLVLMVLCYPVALNKAGILRQNWMMRRAAKVLDGVLFPDEAMRDYFIEQGLCPKTLPSLILPPCWPASFQSRGALPPLLNQTQANVIFTGRTDLSSATIHAADDLRPLMDAILSAGVQLHHVYSRETDDGHPLRQVFQPQVQAELIAAMAAHDASLIAYNTVACERDDRFWLTVPDRLITSVAAGVPVAVPKRGYTGLKQYLAHYPAVIEFDDARHLKQLLSDRARVLALRELAWAARHQYTAERHAELLNGFLNQLVA